ncbi:hypothetical protein Bca4012_053170 [Brassica carinata]
MSDCVAKALQSLNLSWPDAFGFLQAAYFLTHYPFASQTGHASLAVASNTNLFVALMHTAAVKSRGGATCIKMGPLNPTKF